MGRLDKAIEAAGGETDEARAKREERERTVAFLADPERIEALLDLIANGGKLRHYCVEHGVSYGRVQRFLTTNEKIAPLYDAALDARSDLQREQIEEIVASLESGGDPKAAATRIAGLQWLAEKMNPRRYGARQQVDVKVTDATTLHLEAVRQLANKPRPPALEAVETNPGEFTVPQLPSAGDSAKPAAP